MNKVKLFKCLTGLVMFGVSCYCLYQVSIYALVGTLLMVWVHNIEHHTKD